jgi:hypothetical protein
MIARAARLAGVVFFLAVPALQAQLTEPVTAIQPPPSPLIYRVPETVPAPPTSDPGPDGWGRYAQPSPPPGVFASTELAVVFPVLKFAPINETPLGPSFFLVHIPKVGLSTTVSPTFEVGYRLPDCDGLFAVNYRFLVSEGSGVASSLDGVFGTRTRLDSNVLNIDYGTATYEFIQNYLLSFRIGAEIADVYFDSGGVNSSVFEKASTNFFGGGVHGRMDVDRRIVAVPGLSLFGRIDSAVLVGQVNQHFSAGSTTDPLAVFGVGQRRNQTVPWLILQAGVSYCPPGIPGLKITLGYDFERWWYVGQLGINSQANPSLVALGVASNVNVANTPLTPSRGEFWLQGVFLRAEYDF